MGMGMGNKGVRGTMVLVLATLWCGFGEPVVHMRGGGNGQSMLKAVRERETRVDRRVMVVGGTADGELALKTVESLILDAPLTDDGRRLSGTVREWEAHSAMLDARDSCQAVCVERMVYAVGGYNGECELSSVEMTMLDPHSGRAVHPLESGQQGWAWAPHLRKRRCNLGAAAAPWGGGMAILAVGGYNGTHDLPNCELLRVDEQGLPVGEWEWGPAMSCPRSGPAVTACGGAVYAAGGFNGASLLDSVEELKGDKWVRMKGMRQGVRGGACAVTVSGRVYVIGGASGSARLKAVESMDPREGQWREEQSLNCARAGVAGVGVEEKLQICVAGGFDGINMLSSAETFDVRMRGAWLYEPQMTTKRWGASMVFATHSKRR